MEKKDIPNIDAAEAAHILGNVFEECGVEPNTVPMEALTAYTSYRRERFVLLRTILVVALVLFLLLPILFIPPRYEITKADGGERGLPVYSIDVGSLLPVRSIVATLDGKPLPVYEEDSKHYTVEPTRNGKLDITVGLVNHQTSSTSIDVDSVDAEGPELTGSRTDGKNVFLKVEDKGIGVDFDGVYAVSGSGKVVKAKGYDRESGEVWFAYPKEKLDVYIPDSIGNTLHISMKIK